MGQILLICGIVIGVVMILVMSGRWYLQRWAKYFVDAAVDRNNRWYRDEGQQMIDPAGFEIEHSGQAPEVEAFWREGRKWSLYNENNDKLMASYFPHHPDKFVILLHDYRSNGWQDCASLALWYHQQGYSVVVPDLRAHGTSGGHHIGLGWTDRLDLIKWITRVLTVAPESQIILHGLSMGAATVLMASGEQLPENVKLLIADSSYTSVYSEFKTMLRRLTKYPVNRFMVQANRYAKQKLGFSLIQASVTRQLGSNHLPVLFLHGANDRFVPATETTTLMEATAGEKELVIFPNCDHLAAKEDQKEHYFDVVSSFIQKHVKKTMNK